MLRFPEQARTDSAQIKFWANGNDVQQVSVARVELFATREERSAGFPNCRLAERAGGTELRKMDRAERHARTVSDEERVERANEFPAAPERLATRAREFQSKDGMVLIVSVSTPAILFRGGSGEQLLRARRPCFPNLRRASQKVFAKARAGNFSFPRIPLCALRQGRDQRESKFAREKDLRWCKRAREVSAPIACASVPGARHPQRSAFSVLALAKRRRQTRQGTPGRGSILQGERYAENHASLLDAAGGAVDR